MEESQSPEKLVLKHAKLSKSQELDILKELREQGYIETEAQHAYQTQQLKSAQMLLNVRKLLKLPIVGPIDLDKLIKEREG